MNLLFIGTGGRGGDSRGIEAWELEQGQREKDRKKDRERKERQREVEIGQRQRRQRGLWGGDS